MRTRSLAAAVGSVVVLAGSVVVVLSGPHHDATTRSSPVIESDAGSLAAASVAGGDDRLGAIPASPVTVEDQQRWRDRDGAYDLAKMPRRITCLGLGGRLVEVTREVYVRAFESREPRLCDGTLMPGVGIVTETGPNGRIVTDAWVDGVPHSVDSEGYFVDKNGRRAQSDTKVDGNGMLVPIGDSER